MTWLKWFHRKSKTVGQCGEDLAARALRRAGYTLLQRNARLGAYEIDIIAREGDTTAFVEVKTRRTADPVPPEENVGYTKRRHIRAAAHAYIAREDNPEMYYRYDIVSVIMPEQGKPEVSIFRDAFHDE